MCMYTCIYIYIYTGARTEQSLQVALKLRMHEPCDDALPGNSGTTTVCTNHATTLCQAIPGQPRYARIMRIRFARQFRDNHGMHESCDNALPGNSGTTTVCTNHAVTLWQAKPGQPRYARIMR